MWKIFILIDKLKKIVLIYAVSKKLFHQWVGDKYIY